MNPERVGRDFQEGTKFVYMRKPSDMELGAPVPDPKKPVPSKAKVFRLPDVDRIRGPEVSFVDLLAGRRSRREFRPEPLSMDELSVLLWATQGVLNVVDGHSLRTSPSAGARHPLETYLGIHRVEGLDSGLYRYLPFRHAVAALTKDPAFGANLAAACLDQDFLDTCAVAFVWTAVIQRSRWKYQERGYRYVYLDAGHVCQNLYLTCETLGLGCCAVGAFDDDAVNRLVGADGTEEFALYLAAVGKRET